MTYEVPNPGKGKAEVYQVNLLKEWKERKRTPEGAKVREATTPNKFIKLGKVMLAREVRTEDEVEDIALSMLTTTQQADLSHLLKRQVLELTQVWEACPVLFNGKQFIS